MCALKRISKKNYTNSIIKFSETNLNENIFFVSNQNLKKFKLTIFFGKNVCQPKISLLFFTSSRETFFVIYYRRKLLCYLLSMTLSLLLNTWSTFSLAISLIFSKTEIFSVVFFFNSENAS